jgi:hypothetical protein
VIPGEVLDFSGLSGSVGGRYSGRMPEAPILPAAPEPTPLAPIPSPQAEPIALAQAQPALQTPPTGQLLLGTDKRNPVFAVYEEDSGELEGRSTCHKLTPAVENFARLRWPDLVAERSYGAVGRLLLEIQSVFGVEISRSGLQGLVRVLKGGPAPEEPSLAAEDPASSLPRPEAGAGLAARELAEVALPTRESSVKSVADAPADKALAGAVQPRTSDFNHGLSIPEAGRSCLSQIHRPAETVESIVTRSYPSGLIIVHLFRNAPVGNAYTSM